MTPPQITTTPPTEGRPANQEKNRLQRQPRRSRQQTKETGRPETNTTTGDTSNKNSPNNIERRRSVEEPSNNSNQSIPDRAEDQRYVTIQTSEGGYDSRLRIDNSNRCPPRGKLNIARCIIPAPPRMTHNAPKYYADKKLPPPQVLNFDIRNPGPCQKL